MNDGKEKFDSELQDWVNKQKLIIMMVMIMTMGNLR